MATTSDLQLYGKGKVYNEDGEQTEAQSINVEVTSNANDVNTLSKNLAGFSPGSIKTTITVQGAIPAAGWELNPGKYISKTKITELTVVIGGLTMTLKGIFKSYTISTATDSAATISFTFEGGDSPFEGSVIG